MNVLIFDLKVEGITPAALRVHSCEKAENLINMAITLDPEYIIIHADQADWLLDAYSKSPNRLKADIIVVCPISTPQVIREWTSKGAAMAWNELNWENELHGLIDVPASSQTEVQHVLEHSPGMSQIITVGSTYGGAGSTHTAFLLASFLARHCKTKVALVERGSNPCFHQLDEFHNGQKNSFRPRFEIDRLTLFKGTGSSKWVDSATDDFQYVVVDMGDIEQSEDTQAFFRSSLPVLVASASDWRFQELHDFIKRNNVHRQDRMRIAFPMASDEAMDALTTVMKNRLLFSLPPHGDPFTRQEDTDEVLESILFPLMPKRSKGPLARLFGRQN
ncbi:hypothetical protein [Paenibacillus polymyxa]|uniref:hypothetical protein n=1 Tax=Paenibacillus polymyxa TaxID=1406 RepID=UPI0025B67BB1|nr:hypothetical protein [Paenibacillus polymyxa]MDN4090891.1 hypothetical protein [Paenibacillus polymyxa]